MTSEPELRQLIESYREAAQRMPADEFCGHAMGNGVSRIETAILLRDLYGRSLEECKIRYFQFLDRIPRPSTV